MTLLVRNSSNLLHFQFFLAFFKLFSLPFFFHAAILSLLKSVGAEVPLTYVITGESLLNDGTSLVLYTLFYELIAKEPEYEVSPTFVVIYFIKVITLSNLVGIAMGATSIVVIGLANRRYKEDDTTIQLAVTFCCAYFSFYVAQRILLVSGVIACFTSGVVLARYAVPRYLKPETIEAVWTAIEWLGNTLLFFLAGLVIGKLAVFSVQGIDLVFIIVVYVFLNVARMAMVLLLFPALYYSGTGCNTFPKAIFVGWVGLRGAVSVALALSIYQNTLNGNTTLSRDDAEVMMFLVGGIGALTLLINATTAKPMLFYFHLLDDEGDLTQTTTTAKSTASEQGESAVGGSQWDDSSTRQSKKVNPKGTGTISGGGGGGKQKETKLMFEYLKKRIRLKVYNLIETLQKQYLTDYLDLAFIFRHCSILKTAPEASAIPKSPKTDDEELEEELEDEGDEELFSEMIEKSPLSELSAEEKAAIREKIKKTRHRSLPNKPRTLSNLSTKQIVSRADYRLIHQEVEAMRTGAGSIEGHQHHPGEGEFKNGYEEGVTHQARKRSSSADQIHIKQAQDEASPAPSKEEDRRNRSDSTRKRKHYTFKNFARSRVRSLSVQKYGGEEDFDSFSPKEVPPIDKPRPGSLVKYQSQSQFPYPTNTESRSYSQPSEYTEEKNADESPIISNRRVTFDEGRPDSLRRIALLAPKEAVQPLETMSEAETERRRTTSGLSDGKAKEEELQSRKFQELPSFNVPKSEATTSLKSEIVDGVSGEIEEEDSDFHRVVPSLPHSASQPQNIGFPTQEKVKIEQLKEKQKEEIEKRKESIDPLLGPRKLLSFRLLHNIVYDDLLITMRKVFLEVLRVNYFKQINSGQLPSKSFAALLLLQSVDKSLYTMNTVNDKLEDLNLLTQSHFYLKKLYEKRTERKMSVFSATTAASRHASSTLSAMTTTTREEAMINPTRSTAGSDTMSETAARHNNPHHHHHHYPNRNQPSKNKDTRKRKHTLQLDVEGDKLFHADHEVSRVTRDPEEELEEKRFLERLQSLQSMNGTSNKNNNRIEDSRKTEHTNTNQTNRANEDKETDRNGGGGAEDDDVKAFEDSFFYYSIHLQTAVMILMAFIEGHEFAQSRITFYLGENELGIDTPEEDIVINESKQLVAVAKDLLLMIYKPILKYIYSKRILFSIFSLQQTLIEQFVTEGIINVKYSEILYEEIHSDIDHLQALERKKILFYYYRRFRQSGRNVENKEAKAENEVEEEEEEREGEATSTAAAPAAGPTKQEEPKYHPNRVKLLFLLSKSFLEYYFEEFFNSYFFMKERWLKAIGRPV
jgi:NhaP-type Na+/H+ or K+/H+ antiporter